LKKKYALDLDEDYYYKNPVKILGRFNLRCKYITHSIALDLLYIGIFLFFIISMIFLFESPHNLKTTGLQEGQSLNMNAGLGAKDISEIIKNYVTCLTFLIGAVWAYMAFIRKRENYPCASVSHRLMHRRIDENRVFLKVIVDIKNEGDVMISLERKLVRVQQMIPWTSEALESVEVGPDVTRNKECEVEWPLLAEVDLHGEKQGEEIEPGESDEFHVDFVIPAEVNTVVVYSYLKNVRKRKKEIGWNTTSVYDIKNGENS